ncbi:DUF4376 domain-containing protein [Phascolarctobacterium succinatutens]|uniref:DUF4376 domain-containing protein n=1 Tax=Phascolarctobacterium succinatutens TaxID=626940 RepID=UPI0023F428AA|nr:DUF4376 domain-containing protein [Phascolarctobacterium succinatutens]
MIGTKFYKGQFTDEQYSNCAEWCNENQTAYIEDKGEYYECVAIPTPSLDELKAQKLTELKNIRDTEEVKPISYNGNLFDFDDKARDRINSAIIALSITGQSIEWTTADNSNVIVTADDLRGVVANVAVRSNELHVRYREIKASVLVCETAEEVDKIVW